MAERKNPELDAQHQAILRKMIEMALPLLVSGVMKYLVRQRPENKTCADCKRPSPRWASTNLGIFVCIGCSGIHRKLGTHISQVRSITLDTWTPSQVAHFQKRGNAKAAQYFEACMPADFQRPPQGDAMQLERFIREKYEKKRFITVENGGLGGASASSAHWGAGASRASQGYGGVRPEKDQFARDIGSNYDDGTSSRRTATSSMSYGGRFGGSSNISSSARPSQFGSSTGTFNAGRSLGGGGSRASNAFQRASTLREILNMGFSPHLAARAVEAGDGDLERAVEWVLAPDRSQSEHRPLSPVAKKAVEKPIEINLLDFGDPEPTVSSNASSAPKAVSTEPLMGLPSASTQAATQPVEDDFGDFGAFESALPTHTPAPQSSTTNPATTSFSSSLASLYARPKPAVPAGQASSSPTRQAFSLPKNPSQQSPQLRSFGSPQKSPLRSAAGPKITPERISAVSPSKKTSPGIVEFPKFEWPLEKRNSASQAKNIQTIPPVALTPAQHTTGSQPPPPPIASVNVADPKTGPAPPETPPPQQKSNGLEVKPDASQTTKRQSEISGSSERDPADASKVVKEEKQEDEDPFAALSMFALNSATMKKTPNQPSKLKDPSSSLIPERTGSQGIDLDELLG